MTTPAPRPAGPLDGKVHAGGPDSLPLHPIPPGESTLVAFHRSRVTCVECVALLLPLDDRRQRAREAFEDAMSAPSESHDGPLLMRAAERQRRARETAIETATRVRVTHDVVMAFIEAPDNPDDIVGPLIAAFRAAGFEVEE